METGANSLAAPGPNSKYKEEGAEPAGFWVGWLLLKAIPPVLLELHYHFLATHILHLDALSLTASDSSTSSKSQTSSISFSPAALR